MVCKRLLGDSLVDVVNADRLKNLGLDNVSNSGLCHDLRIYRRVSVMLNPKERPQPPELTGIETASMISLIILGSDMRATPPSRLMSDGTRSKACRGYVSVKSRAESKPSARASSFLTRAALRLP